MGLKTSFRVGLDKSACSRVDILHTVDSFMKSYSELSQHRACTSQGQTASSTAACSSSARSIDAEEVGRYEHRQLGPS